MIFTSYFAKTKKLLESGEKNLIAISGYVPKFYSDQMQTDDRLSRCLELAPKKDWFFQWKNGEIDNEKYVELYRETVLEKIDIEKLYEKIGENAVLLCYEKPTDFCHRHLVAAYFNEKLGLNITEIEI